MMQRIEEQCWSQLEEGVGKQIPKMEGLIEWTPLFGDASQSDEELTN
jgi:hypothetical protein